MKTTHQADRVAIVGAGIAGLACAVALRARGCPVVLFEKARGPGGRMATRRDDAATYDLGAHVFDAEEPRFARQVRLWVTAGVVAPWSGRFGRLGPGGFTPQRPARVQWVGTPRMSAITRHMAHELDLRTGHRVAALEAIDGGWRLWSEDERDLGIHPRVVVATPAPQAVPLLAPLPAFAARAAEAPYAPAWAAMLDFQQPVGLPFDAARPTIGPLALLARDAAKPGRPPGHRWVVHATPAWSAEHLERDAADVAADLADAFALFGPRPDRCVAHRWRYALPIEAPAVAGALWDPASSLGAAGDWLGGARVEGAWLSGLAAAEAILSTV